MESKKNYNFKEVAKMIEIYIEYKEALKELNKKIANFDGTENFGKDYEYKRFLEKYLSDFPQEIDKELNSMLTPSLEKLIRNEANLGD